jgi:hypothetical protein
MIRGYKCPRAVFEEQIPLAPELLRGPGQSLLQGGRTKVSRRSLPINGAKFTITKVIDHKFELVGRCSVGKYLSLALLATLKSCVPIPEGGGLQVAHVP